MAVQPHFQFLRQSGELAAEPELDWLEDREQVSHKDAQFMAQQMEPRVKGVMAEQRRLAVLREPPQQILRLVVVVLESQPQIPLREGATEAEWVRLTGGLQTEARRLLELETTEVHLTFFIAARAAVGADGTQRGQSEEMGETMGRAEEVAEVR
jgi:hypothetical protein